MRARLQNRCQERPAGIAGTAIESKARAPVFLWPLASLSAVPGMPPVQRRAAAHEPDEEAPLLGAEAPDAGLADDDAQPGPGKRRRRLRRHQRQLARQRRRDWKKKHPKPGTLKRQHKKLKREREKLKKMLRRDLRWNKKNDPDSMTPEQAKAIVAKVAADSFAGDYAAAYEYLKDDPKVWAPGLPQESIKSVHNKSHMKSYVYLPSLDREVPVNETWTFDVIVPLANLFPRTAYYNALSFDDIVGLGAFDAEITAEILRNINRSGVTVTFQARMELSPASDFATGSAPAPQIRQMVAGRSLEDTAETLIDSTIWDLSPGELPAGAPDGASTGANWTCQLIGSVRAVGSYKAPPEMTESHIGATKEYAVKNRVK